MCTFVLDCVICVGVFRKSMFSCFLGWDRWENLLGYCYWKCFVL